MLTVLHVSALCGHHQVLVCYKNIEKIIYIMIIIKKKKILTMCSQVEVYHNLFIHLEDGGRRILSNKPYQTMTSQL